MKNVFLSLLLFVVISCKSQPDTSLAINADRFEKGINDSGIQVLDVRTAGEYSSGHIKKALLADWTNKKEFNDRIQYVDKDKPVYIYCLAGSRSAAAADWMRKNGFQNVLELEGGMNAWKAATKPIEGSSNEKQMTVDEYWTKIPVDNTVLVDFGATWCPPCVKMEPVLEEIQKDTSLHFQFVKIDAGLHTDVMKALSIEPIPVFIIYKNGKEQWRKEGIVSIEELKTHLQ